MISYKHKVAIIYTIALFLDRLDLTIVNIALPTISKYFQVPITSTDWISIAFIIAMSISMPICSWLGNKFGFKTVLITSMYLFGFGSSLCSVSQSIPVIIMLRFIQGIGGGMIIPLGMSYIYNLYKKHEYASITSYTFIPSLIAPTIAPFLGGVIVKYLGWRFLFLFSGPICIALAVYTTVVLREYKDKDQKSFDWTGYLTISVTLVFIFITLSNISKGDFSFFTKIYILISISFFILFLFFEKKSNKPIINLSFYLINKFRKANIIQLCFQFCHFGSIFMIGIFLQVVSGFSPMLAGLIMGMQAIGALMTSRLSVKLFNQISMRCPLVIGLIGVGCITPCILLIRDVHFIFMAILIFIIRGIFSGLCGTPIQTLSVIDIKSKDLSTANSMFAICRQFSISLGIAISSMIISFGFRSLNIKSQHMISYYDSIIVFKYVFITTSIVSLIGAIFAFTIKPDLQ